MPARVLANTILPVPKLTARVDVVSVINLLQVRVKLAKSSVP